MRDIAGVLVEIDRPRLKLAVLVFELPDAVVRHADADPDLGQLHPFVELRRLPAVVPELHSLDTARCRVQKELA